MTGPRVPGPAENEAADVLLEWFERYGQLVSDGVLAGMLLSAAAQLLTKREGATREVALEMMGRAWDRWVKRAPLRGQDRGEPS